MNKFVKKLISAFALMTAAMVLVACGSGGGTASSSEESTTTEDGKVQIEFWYGLGSEAGQTMEEIISEFNASQENYEVVGVQQADYGATWEAVQAAYAGGNAPAVWLGFNDQYAGEDGILVDLNDLYASEEFAADELISTFVEPIQIDGNYYGVPIWGTTQVMYYNSNVFEEAGVDPEEAFASWENLADASEEIQANTDADFGHMIMWGYENLQDMAFSNGGQLLSDDGTEVMINSPEWVEAWEFAREQLHGTEAMGVISGGQGWEYWYNTIDQVMQGNAGSYTGSAGDRGDLDFEYIRAIPQPGLNGNQPAPRASGNYMVMSNQNTEEEKAAGEAWMTFFTNPASQSKWSLKIGYVPIRLSVMEDPEYQAFIDEYPWANVPFEQSEYATTSGVYVDPTGGAITSALAIAADRIELENIPAQEALDEAYETAQKELDDWLEDQK